MSISNHTKSYKNILIYYIGYMAPNPLILITGNAKGYIEKSGGNKNCIVSTNEGNNTLKKV